MFNEYIWNTYLDANGKQVVDFFEKIYPLNIQKGMQVLYVIFIKIIALAKL